LGTRDFYTQCKLPPSLLFLRSWERGDSNPAFILRPSIREINIVSRKYKLTVFPCKSRCSAVGIMTGYGLDVRGAGVRVPVG
jgi:hypothetical protein